MCKLFGHFGHAHKTIIFTRGGNQMSKPEQFLKISYNLLALRAKYHLKGGRSITITGDKICLLVLIRNLSKTRPCTADNQYLSEVLHASTSTIDKWIRELKTLNLITTSTVRRKGTKSTTVRAMEINYAMIDQIVGVQSPISDNAVSNYEASIHDNSNKDTSNS